MARDYYDALGVSRDAGQEEIKEAYREKARELHPDASDRDDAEERFKEVQKAYDVLGDEEKREAYDQMGHQRFQEAEKQGFDPGEQGGAAGGVGGGGFPGGAAGGFDLGDLFGDLFDMGGRGRGGTQRKRVSLSLEEVYSGATREVTVEGDVDCPDCDGVGADSRDDVTRCPGCDGAGQVRQRQRTPFGETTTVTACPRCDGTGRRVEDPCSRCRGEGKVTDSVSRRVEIPAGVEDGTALQAEIGGQEVLIEIQVEDHEVFERDDSDLHLRRPVTFPQAVFGDNVRVQTIDGEADVEVPAGSQSGEKLRMRGKGLPRLRGGGRGDQYVHLQVAVPDPDNLSSEEREALKEFAEAGGREIEADGLFDRLKRGVFN